MFGFAACTRALQQQIREDLGHAPLPTSTMPPRRLREHCTWFGALSRTLHTTHGCVSMSPARRADRTAMCARAACREVDRGTRSASCVAKLLTILHCSPGQLERAVALVSVAIPRTMALAALLPCAVTIGGHCWGFEPATFLRILASAWMKPIPCPDGFHAVATRVGTPFQLRSKYGFATVELDARMLTKCPLASARMCS